MSVAVAIRRGSLHLSAAVYERYFAGLAAVVLLRRGDGLLVLPVRFAGGGGYLAKQRNGAGDRVVDAADFFREQGLADAGEWNVAAAWDAGDMGLRIDGIFAPVMDKVE
ncbi:hypothetical protein [Zavarzinia sp.]|uniref:hypothetical protein n=1 Tax=Zavarzinia sp. TaxID=2027920 RepID=UPI003569FC18